MDCLCVCLETGRFLGRPTAQLSMFARSAAVHGRHSLKGVKDMNRIPTIGCLALAAALLIGSPAYAAPHDAPGTFSYGAASSVQGRMSAQSALSWSPPQLNDPTTIELTAGTRRHYTLNLDRNRDYIIRLPNVPLDGGLSINGGHNILLVGGEINIPWQGDGASISSRRMLKIQDATGVVHIEGLLGRGEDLSEGIQIASPEAIIQLQNIRIEHVHARDQSGFSDNHPDLIQPWGDAREIRIDRFTGSSDYQGIFLKCDYGDTDPCQLGKVIIRRTNIIGDPTARYLFWVEQRAGSGEVVLEDFWIDVPERRWASEGRLARAVWPDYREDAFGEQRAYITTESSGLEYAAWPNMTPTIEGRIYEGMPPSGDFVPEGVAGIGYISPGYADGAPPPPPPAIEPTATPLPPEPATEAAPPQPTTETPTEQPLPTAEPVEAGPEAPAALSPTDTSACQLTHTVQRGENLFRIGRRYGIPYQEIAAANGITNPRRIDPGLVLVIPICPSTPAPESTAEAACWQTHTVRRGENLFRIGQRYGIPYQEIAAANGITNPRRIQVGLMLRIPLCR